MKLIDYELIPSVVQDAKDPECLGRIKCVIPGKIHHDSCKTTEHMPWVRPLNMFGYQTFSKELEGHKVWVLHNKMGYNEYWYVPIHEPINIVQDFLKEHYEDNPEILLARNLGGNKVMMRYDDKTGFMYEIGKDFINLNPSEAKYEVRSGNGKIAIESGIVQLGSYADEQYEKAVKGDTLVKKFNIIHNGITQMKTACVQSPLSLLIPGLTVIEQALSSIEEILATNTKLN